MYVKDTNGKYKLVDKKEETTPQQVPQTELIKAMNEAAQLIRTCRELLEQRK